MGAFLFVDVDDVRPGDLVRLRDEEDQGLTEPCKVVRLEAGGSVVVAERDRERPVGRERIGSVVRVLWT
ncbi:hypothetical protein [Alsobacter sp. R-9]